MKKNVRIITVAVLGLIALIVLSPVTTEASNTTGTISIIGNETLRVNHEISATFRFSPGDFQITSGGVITFENLVTPDPHTISIVDPSALPTTVGQVFACAGPGTPCGAILATHVPNGFNMQTGQPNPPVLPFVTVEGDPSGFTVSNVQGNSVLIAPGQTVQVAISAPSGTTLHYMCAIHPWMQGTINVK